MGDPRNVAHDKKVIQEKHHKPGESAEGEPGKKSPAKKRGAAKKAPASAESAAAETPVAVYADPTELEKSLVVLSKVKEMEFYSRSNIEKLAELSLTIEDELKQKAFAEPIGALYSAQDAFQAKVAAFIEAYEAECERLKPKK